ncbi:hypothetical protein O181_094370 [Austropuccinia psidii MF-1]|uniref:Reverse transcriptase domain-containing protein n=1 Tax=Austropuccinia psidii MF-1 TaxID=1389203 RepID=A0A9Q3J1Y7_9BASI|nr:hypothetical protein [Austropuccinia psidii MF-1]
MYGIDLHNKKDRYFNIEDNKNNEFAFFPFKREIKLNKVLPVNLELGKFKSEQLKKAEISLHLTDKQENELSFLLYDHKGAFASDNKPLGAIIGHEVDIILNIERPYPPLLRRPAYPEGPKSREALETHIKELVDLGVIRKVGHNEKVEITTLVIVAWHNGEFRMVGDFRALNTYTVPDRYPIPKLQISLTQISQALYITTTDALKRFHQNVVTPKGREYFKIIVHCGVYEYLRMAFGIENAPSHFQRMMTEIFPEDLSKGWLIIYIDDIIVCSKTWEEQMYRLSRVLTKINSVKMKISLKKCHFRFKELKALGHVVSDCKDNSLIHSLDEVWNKTNDEGIFHLLDGIIYHRTKHTCVMIVVDRSLINLVLQEFHDRPFPGYLSEDRTREKVKTCIWWPMLQKDVAEYCKTCDRFQKANKSTGKRLGNMIKIQEPIRPWEIIHMDWVTGLPPQGYRSYNACLVIVDKFSEIQSFKHVTKIIQPWIQLF